ncbi:hypothetical protein ACOME3_003548 [Neoechinorhynchus agilis]
MYLRVKRMGGLPQVKERDKSRTIRRLPADAVTFKITSENEADRMKRRHCGDRLCLSTQRASTAHTSNWIWLILWAFELTKHEKIDGAHSLWTGRRRTISGCGYQNHKVPIHHYRFSLKIVGQNWLSEQSGQYLESRTSEIAYCLIIRSSQNIKTFLGVHTIGLAKLQGF